MAQVEHLPATRDARWDPPHSYLDFAKTGSGSTGMYILGTVIILTLWFGVGSVLMLLVMGFGVVLFGAGELDLGAETFDPAALLSESGMPPWLLMASTLVSFIPLALGVPFVVRVVHNRPWRSVVTPFERINWGLVGKGALMWLIPMALTGALGLFWDSDSLTWSFDPVKFIPFAIVVVLLTFVQTTAEELFFRGYLAQWLASYRRRIVFISVITGLIFASVHLPNALLLGFGGYDLVVGMVPYFAIGFVLAWVSYTSGTIELAVGAHFINNFVAFLLVSTPELPGGGALFEAEEISAGGSAFTSVVSCLIFWLLVRRTRGSGNPMPVAPVNPPKVAPTPATVSYGGAGYGDAGYGGTGYGGTGYGGADSTYVAAAGNDLSAAGASPLPPAGWYPDPIGAGRRYWDGQRWTEYTAP